MKAWGIFLWRTSRRAPVGTGKSRRSRIKEALADPVVLNIDRRTILDKRRAYDLQQAFLRSNISAQQQTRKPSVLGGLGGGLGNTLGIFGSGRPMSG